MKLPTKQRPVSRTSSFLKVIFRFIRPRVLQSASCSVEQSVSPVKMRACERLNQDGVRSSLGISIFGAPARSNAEEDLWYWGSVSVRLCIQSTIVAFTILSERSPGSGVGELRGSGTLLLADVDEPRARKREPPLSARNATKSPGIVQPFTDLPSNLTAQLFFAEFLF